ncbi:glycoside hydrolase [Shewanella sp. C32]|uniref:Glycoside hydrolase n=1 Tax=Shewanella electrica TaxID=515560 RepID=A0ABT2FHD7_9GAMM|nr:glycoside hydrolase [Shewanella electrica]MCH1923650.1 glycoside hydrolase [Shewanella electrica]MCS4555745.1 glycoside hydrolase [Shewanella electrica]
MKLLSCQRIWDQANHNAFTDLCEFNGHLYTVFREGAEHISPDGAFRLLSSNDDGEHWQSVAHFTSPIADLRDGKLLVANGRLWVFGAAAMHDKTPLQSLMWYSDNGVDWSETTEVGERGYWLWGLTVAADGVYGVGYRAGADGDTRLYRSDLPHADKLLVFMPLLAPLQADGYVNESALLFEQHQAVCLLRRDPVWDSQRNALFGQSVYPYSEWHWCELDQRIGGPAMVRCGERLIAIVRLYDQRVRTAVVEVDPVKQTIIELLSLPSGGDTSYAGIVQRDEQLLVSYYSSHEGKTAIYFARINLGQ